MLPSGSEGGNRHELAMNVSALADIQGGDAVAAERPSGVSDALSVRKLEATLDGEITTLGYPQAALFAFCVALVSYNVLSTVKAALRAAHGADEITEAL